MYEKIINFWFHELHPEQWWRKDKELDNKITTQFMEIHMQAKQGELFFWRDSKLGSLAEVIVLDQFSRNMYRDKPASFECDSMALVLAQISVFKGFDISLSEVQRGFLYLPFMHSESKLIHIEAEKLYQKLGNSEMLDFEYKHKRIIDRFGRYPHRNEILGRQSTKEELEFLKQKDSSF